VKRLVPLGIALSFLLVPAAGGDAASVRTVTVKDIDFSPTTITVRRGDSVRWVFADGSTSHNVIARGSRRFAGSPVKSSGTHRVRFKKAGTYRYVCTLHFGMDGRVVVR
jgi:plastocyanin